MGFIGVYKAIYDYAPQSEGELQIDEGDLLYILEKSKEDDWWKAKKKAGGDDEEEPVGLIPNNYVEEAQPVSHARALYEYTRQTDEELSFPEDAKLEVFDTSDPDWILVGLDGDYGFVPSNYIELGDGGDDDEPAPAPAPPSLPSRPAMPAVEDISTPPLPPRGPPSEPSSPVATGPAAALAGVLAGRSVASPPPPLNLPPRPQYTSEPSDEESAQSPPLPSRTRTSTIQSTISNDHRDDYSPPARRDTYDDYEPPSRPSGLSPGGFHMYNINEMVSVMGKRKKMPTTLGINLKTGTVLIAPERAQDGPSQEWTADRMTHYSREGKHVFMELVRPSKSVDFHAGAKDTAEEIVSALGELAGAVRAEGLREVIMAGTGQTAQKKGQMLYDFMAQGEDEVTVAIGDEVIVLDDTKSDEWWMVRRLKNGKEGVVPSSYVEITGTIPTATTTSTQGINAGKSTVAQNRLEEERLTKEALKAARRDDEKRASEVGPGMRLPERGSSLSARDHHNNAESQRKRENGRSESGSHSRSGKSKPDPSKVRTWTDRSKSFSVEAQFLGLKDGKLNLHKMNGVKIAVPVAKMSVEDLEYVERMTGISLDEDKPLSEVKKARQAANKDSGSSGRVGASVEPKKPDYDWFQFFLSCDVNVGLCERYAQAFTRDSMDESVLPDVDAAVLRNLGLREGDIIKVMRYLDNKYGRNRKKGEEGDEAAGGLFSGPGGTLRNNTRRGRPEPTRQASDVVDAKAFSKQKDSDTASSSPAPLTPATTTTSVSTGKPSGFDDDAWDVKPAKQQAPAQASPPAVTSQPAPAAVPAPTPKPVAALTPGMQELSLLTQPLEPAKTATASPPASAPAITQPPPPQAPTQAPQPTGATPGFFTTLAQQQTGLPNAQPLNLGLGQRQRPAPPQVTQGQGALMPPPPARPFSAPQSAQPSGFAPPPLQPQMTGQVAPPGQSLNEINQMRLQQQYAQQMQQQQMQAPQMGFPQQTGPGMFPMQTGMPAMQPQPTGFPQNQFIQPMMNGQQMQSPFADPTRPMQFSPVQAQPTGFPGQFGQFGGAQAGGVNSYLPPALEPQRTGMPPMQPQPTGIGGFTQGFGNAGMPQQQQPPPMAPLQPQKTGPAPPVRFGVQPEAKKIMPQPTGRRANLSAATPQNPFGF